MVKSKVSTVEQYLAALPDERRAVVTAVLEVIRKNLPKGYNEGINWGNIAFEVPLQRYPTTYNKRPLAYAGLVAQKNHFALYLNCIDVGQPSHAPVSDLKVSAMSYPRCPLVIRSIGDLRLCVRAACLCYSLTWVFLSPSASASDPVWVGTKVMLKETAKPKLGNQVLEWSAVRQPAKVTQAMDGWLWVGTAWVRPADVVPLADAPAYFTTLLKSGRNNVVAYALRGISWYARREYDNAIKDFSEAIQLEPGNTSFFTLRGHAYFMKHLYDAALADFTEAIRLDPTNLVAYNDRGCTLKDKGEYHKAEEQFNEVLRVAPKNALAFANRGTLWFAQDDLDKALADLNRSIQIDPKQSFAYANRGRVYMKRGDYPEAMADYDKAIAIDPDEWPAYNGRARILATAPEFEFHLRDGKQAVEVATKACEMSAWSEWLCVATLAAAYAEAGDFEAAVKWQKKAIEMSQPAEEKKQRENEHRLELYEAGRPFYEEVKLVEERKDEG